MMKLALVTLFSVVCAVSAKSVGNIPHFSPYTSLAEQFERADQIRRSEESRITGGELAPLGSFTYQAGLIVHYGGRDSVCGGSLVSENRVLTAAHCWLNFGIQATAITAVLGTNTIFTGGTRVTSTDIVMHPNWDSTIVRNDIAFIRITPVQYSNLIAPVALPALADADESFVGFTATISGYGITGDGAGIAANQPLRFVDVPVITNAECEQTFGTYIQPTNLCTSGAGGRNACSSDSGGPVVVNSRGRTVQVGIVSFGSAFGCQAGLPAAHARVTAYSDFINEHL